MKNFAITTWLFLLCMNLFGQNDDAINLNVHVKKPLGDLKHIWAWYGYDEPNYTYMKDGKKLLSELAEMSPVPVYVRAHNLMTTGEGTYDLKWGSTNMYTEDADGNPIYNWKIIDNIFDTYVNRGMKPLAQIGFMPEALSTKPKPYRHNWKPGVRYGEILTGWAYPPNDYDKWRELNYQWVKHCIERYGKEEVESWYWEVWNEPDAGYLQAKNRLKTYCKMYDYAADGVRKALPTAKIGGPHSTGGAAWFVKGFIRHCLYETNAATGKVGAPLDFLAFHAKGSPSLKYGTVVMKMSNQLQNVNDNFAAIASFKETKNLPIIIGESDPEGCAACGMNTNPENAYRNGTMYSSYTAASIPRIYDLAQFYGVNLIGAVNWSFEFEEQPWFYGFRSLATNGVDKPVLNVFRMLGMMSGQRVQVTGNTAYDFQKVRDISVRGYITDINGFAAADKKSVTVMVWNYHDKDEQDEGKTIHLTLQGVSAKKGRLYHYRIDNKHSNAYEVWKAMGSPQNPTKSQIKTLEKSGQLELFEKPKPVNIIDGKLHIKTQLPRQAVSFFKVVI